MFRSPEKRSMYDWLDLLRSRLLAVPSDAFAALSDYPLNTGFFRVLIDCSCFTAEDPKVPLWARSNTLSILPRHGHRRDRIPREAMIYMASSLPGEGLMQTSGLPLLIQLYLSMEAPNGRSKSNHQSRHSRTLPCASSITINEYVLSSQGAGADLSCL